MGILIRFLKSAILATVMYFSLRRLGFAAGPSFAFCLVPLVLGALNVMAGVAYGLTGLNFVMACSAALFQIPNPKRQATQAITYTMDTADHTADRSDSYAQSVKPPEKRL